LKLKEISYIHSEAFPAGELKHGPLALVTADTPTLAILMQEDVLEKTLSNVSEVKARQGMFSCSVSSGTGRGSKTLVDGRFSFLIHCPCLHHLLVFLCFSCLLTTMPS